MKRPLTRRISGLQLLVVGFLVAVLLPAGLSPRGAEAQTEALELAGIEGSARASGVYAYYNLGGVLPIASPVDSSAPDAFTTISSGPATFAQAAVYNPGDLLASPDTVLQLFSPDYEPGTLPPYPFRISATSGFGEPTAESNPAPGLQARVETQATESMATASVGRSEAPSILTLGAVKTTSTSTTDGVSVTEHAITEVTDVSLLGVLEIDSIITEVTATSDGTDVVLSGKTTIGTASIAGERVTIDEEGIHPQEQSTSLLGGLLNGLSGQVSDLLAEAGITVTLGGTVAQDAERAGQMSTTGLRIDLDITGSTAPLLGDVFDLLDVLDLPPIDGAPLQLADLLEIPRSRNLVRIEVASAEVSLAATLATAPPVFEPPSFEASAPPTPSAPTGGASFPTQVAGPVSGTPVPSPLADTPAAPAPVSRTTVATLSTGIGTLLVLALLVQPVLGYLLQRWSHRVLTPAALGGACALEARHG